MSNPAPERLIEWGVASEAAPGEIVSGDLHLVRVDRDRVLIGVIDGAGHGEEAASTARAAVSLLERYAAEPLDSILTRCHDGLRAARGAAMSLAAMDISKSQLAWTGVGNVEGAFLCRKDEARTSRETLLLRNGVIGYQFTPPRVSTLPVHNGDMLVFVTDGVASQFLDGADLDGQAQAVADSILSRHAKGADDALVLVVRFLKEPA